MLSHNHVSSLPYKPIYKSDTQTAQIHRITGLYNTFRDGRTCDWSHLVWLSCLFLTKTTKWMPWNLFHGTHRVCGWLWIRLKDLFPQILFFVSHPHLCSYRLTKATLIGPCLSSTMKDFKDVWDQFYGAFFAEVSRKYNHLKNYVVQLFACNNWLYNIRTCCLRATQPSNSKSLLAVDDFKRNLFSLLLVPPNNFLTSRNTV